MEGLQLISLVGKVCMYWVHESTIRHADGGRRDGRLAVCL